MALSDNRTQRTVMLCAMYVAQGIPWGFMTIALISYLTERGVGDAEAGELTAIVLVPWTFKLIWAPLIDTMTIRSMGRRRPWIIGAELMMAVSLLGILAAGDLTENLRLLYWMFFVHNIFSSLQDVATDALAVDVLPFEEQGRTNGMMWGSKLIGRAAGAIVMAHLIDAWGLPAAVLAQFFILLGIMLFPMLMLERPGEKRFPWSDGQAQGVGADTSLRSPAAVLRDLRRAFSLTTNSVFFVFGTVNVIGWGVVEVVTKTLYTQQLDWTFVELSNVAGLAVITEMVGAFGGGYLADRYGRRRIMTLGFGGYGLLAVVFGACPHLWHEQWFAAGYLFFNPGILAVGAVGYLSMSMRISWTRAAATVFTIYLTVSNIGHVLGNWLVGTLRQDLSLSYEETFFAVGGFMFVPLLMLLVVRTEEVDRHKELAKQASDG
jgi:PAT family beta-lactamase induction signal transducer AmpG